MISELVKLRLGSLWMLILYRYLAPLPPHKITRCRQEADSLLRQDGISQKVDLTLTAVATFVGSLTVGLIRSWKLTLIMLSVVFMSILVMGGVGKRSKKFQSEAVDTYGVSDSVAEEAISSIGQSPHTELNKRWRAAIQHISGKSHEIGLQKQSVSRCHRRSHDGSPQPPIWLGVLEGGRLLKAGEVSVSKILTVVLASLLAGASLGHVAPHFGARALIIDFRVN